MSALQEEKKNEAIAKKNTALAAEPEEEEHHLSDEDHAVQKQIERVLKENRAGDIARAREGGVMDQEKQA